MLFLAHQIGPCPAGYLRLLGGHPALLRMCVYRVRLHAAQVLCCAGVGPAWPRRPGAAWAPQYSSAQLALTVLCCCCCRFDAAQGWLHCMLLAAWMYAVPLLQLSTLQAC